MGNGPHRVWAGVSGVAAHELVEELGNLLVGLSSWAWIIFFNGHGIRIGEMLATDAFVLVAGEMQSNLGPSAETRLVLIGKDVRRSTS